jgi:FPC/CPF motif-containing protein YcgG/quercetin dioxygenase-like cupin family protein
MNDASASSHGCPVAGAHSNGVPDGKRSSLFHPAECPPGSWQSLAATLFRERMLDSATPYPCIFGVDAIRKGKLRFAFVPTGPARVGALADALEEFGGVAESLGNRTSLVCFFEYDPALVTIEDFRDHFWTLLQRLHDVDATDWPADVHSDPENPTWEFCFKGTPYFVVASTPAHRQRRSRYFEYFAITFQPRFVFDGLGAATPQGRNAQRIIRKRLGQYDSVALTPHLGNFGEPDNREWVQYFLDDDNTPLPSTARCPLHIQTTHQDNSKERQDMTSPRFDTSPPPSLPDRLAELLPVQGSMELQRDQPGKTHNWHSHSESEELFVLTGEVLLFWNDGSVRRERLCGAGSRIILPAGTVHGSTAGADGAVYVICPEGGQTAETVFLTPEQFPAVP